MYRIPRLALRGPLMYRLAFRYRYPDLCAVDYVPTTAAVRRTRGSLEAVGSFPAEQTQRGAGRGNVVYC